MKEKELLYFKKYAKGRERLNENHDSSEGVHLVFYKVGSDFESMRWEEAVKVALCYGWIDSTVRKLDEDRRKQTFTPRKAKSVWSKLNKSYVEKLIAENLMHESGLAKIEIGKQNGSWNALDHVEELILPEDLQQAFNKNKKAFENYTNFSFTYRKSYLYWLNHAKREATRKNRIAEIIKLCEANIKSRQ